MRHKLSIVVVIIAAFAATVFSQTTEFSYQGSLTDGAVPANGNYDLQFRLFDAAANGSQVGVTLTRTSVPVAAGLFSVRLDFGAVFNGADRFLEIRVQNAGGGVYTTLDPRQKVGSSPYAVQSLNATTAATATNATQLGGVTASQYVVTTDPRMTDTRPPTAGSTNYVQNGTSLQATTNFNISGNGTASGTLSGGIVNATTQYNMSGNRVLSVAGTNNIFVGLSGFDHNRY